MTPEREKEIRLYHSGWLSNPYCSRGQHMDSKTIMELFEEIDRLRGEVTRYKEDYEHACETIAKMHAAAVGEVTGPKRGVIEDVEDIRKERDAFEAEWKCSNAALIETFYENKLLKEKLGEEEV